MPDVIAFCTMSTPGLRGSSGPEGAASGVTLLCLDQTLAPGGSMPHTVRFIAAKRCRRPAPLVHEMVPEMVLDLD
jgi:hypothetical protein